MKKFAKILAFSMILFVGCAFILPAHTGALESYAASIKLNKKTITITKGKTYQLKVLGTKKKVKWSSGKKSIASVTSKGKVTGKNKGTTFIYAKINKKTYKCKVKVETPSLSAASKTIYEGKTFTLKLNGTTRSKKFSTGNPSVATVSSKGVVSGKKAGTAKITVKIADKAYSCKVTVKKPKTTPVAIVNEVVYDNNNILVTYTGTYKDSYGLSVKFSIKNNNNYSIGLYCDGFDADGYMISDPTVYDVYPNTTRNATYLMPENQLEDYNIKTIKNFKAYMEIRDEDFVLLYPFVTKELKPTLQ